MTAEIALLIGQALIKYGPAVARELRDIFAKQEISSADWDKVFSTAEKSYEEYTKPV